MTQDSDEIMRALGVDPRLVDIRDDRRSIDGQKIDRRICICGHAVGRHRDGKNVQILRGGDINDWVCQPNARTCSCKRCVPVLKVSTPLYFVRATDGAADLHALIRGIRTLTLRKGEFEWLVELICAFCKAQGPEHKVLPTPLTKEGKIKMTDGSDGYDALVCEKCRTGL